MGGRSTNLFCRAKSGLEVALAGVDDRLRRPVADGRELDGAPAPDRFLARRPRAALGRPRAYRRSAVLYSEKIAWIRSR